MDLSFFNTKNLFEASCHFFNEVLAVPTTQAITKQKLALKDVLRNEVYKSRAPYTWVTETYFLGTIDETAFENGERKSNLEDAKANKYDSILLFALKIESDKSPTKGQLSELTRAINRSSVDKPVIVLFKYGDFLTYATTERNEYQRKHLQGEKIGKVSLLKDIYIPQPHAGHERILFEMTVNPLETTNYLELFEKWQRVFDLQLLNKSFYRELFYWYLWAIRLVKFPKPADDKNDDITHASISVIRLLTRLIFVWFVKEKHLIPEELFNRKKLQQILRNFSSDSVSESNYYRAILQNLFFATLNTEMNKDYPNSRKFITEDKGIKGQSEDYINHQVYRYKELFYNDKEALSLFETVPFLNGGLFECLDFIEEVNGKFIEKRYDGFSTKKEKQSFVPNVLFFGQEPDIDLSNEFGDDKKFKHEKVRGIIEILNSYKFTITENTPIEEEIALDPELLGKVFENLLASYNPETRTTARKQTGSFYTPREIVDYIVDESLKSTLKECLSSKFNVSEDTIKDNLDLLFSYGHTENPFDQDITLHLIDTISNCKILDPACGSGAFPMGALHRMVFLLNKLDPKNSYWKNAQLQKARQDLELAKKMSVPEIREKAIESAELRIEFIKDSFSSNFHELDYTRKLFLIENCIYGVDIQQIAVQISKLRFFISLVTDQMVIDSKPNRNILSLPNLETKFVSANTLIPISRPDGMLINPDVEQKEKELHEVRQRIFFTRKYNDKKKLKIEESIKRAELKKSLMSSGFIEVTATQMASWNPFDPIKSATFFDTLTMFGFEDGFRIIIGNPPYINIKEQSDDIKAVIKSKYKFSKGADIYVAFIERGLSLLQDRATLTFIVPNKFFGADYGKAIRNHLQFGGVSIQSIWDLKDEKVFENALISTIVLSIRNSHECVPTILIQNDNLHLVDDLFDETGKIQIEANEEDTKILDLIKKQPKLSEFAEIRTGVMGFEYWKMEPIIQEGRRRNSVKIYTNGNFKRYQDLWESSQIKLYKSEYIKPCIELSPEYLNANTIDLFRTKPKIIVRGVSKEISAIIDNDGAGLLVAVHSIIPNKLDIRFLLGILNSKLLNWFHLNTIYSIRIPQGSLKYPISFFDSLPIANPDKLIQNNIGIIVDFILTLMKMDLDSSFYERLLDSIIYELYFPEIFSKADLRQLFCF